MNALEFYKSHESAPLPNVGDLVSLTVEFKVIGNIYKNKELLNKE